MGRPIKAASVALIAGGVGLSAAPIPAAYVPWRPAAYIPSRWQSCAHVNAKYRHGVGKLGAHERTTSADPVTNFYRSTRLYRIAMSYNRGLDRDHDGIACEKH